MTFNIRSTQRNKKNNEDTEVGVYVYIDGKGSIEDLIDIANEIGEPLSDIEVNGASCLYYSAPSTNEEREKWAASARANQERHQNWEARFITELKDKYGEDLSMWPTDVEGWKESKAKGAWPR